MKKCKECLQEKELSEFYPTQGECKICTRKRVRARELILVKDSKWVQKERKRHREKYHRLGYKDLHKPTPEQKKIVMERYKKRFPEKIAAHARIGKLKPQTDGNHLHHWSYNEEHWKDLIEVSELEHNKLHRYTTYDQERKMYRTLEGVLLDTKERHIAYFESIKNLD